MPPSAGVFTDRMSARTLWNTDLLDVPRMREAKFGCILPIETADFKQLVDLAKECERLGYDSVWSYDHLSPFWVPSRRAFECWTLLSALATCTEKIKLGSLVTNTNLRNPTLLAKMTATVDVISGGRLILGLGTGDSMSRGELMAYGYEFPHISERILRLRETILVLKTLCTEDDASFVGQYYKLSHAANRPRPVQYPHPPIWIGGKHPQILDIVAELADGWNYWGLTKDQLARRIDLLSAKCTQHARSPARIIRSWSGTLSLAAPTTKSRSEISDRITAELQNQTDIGTRYFIAYFGSRADPSVYEAFAEVVLQ